MQMLIESIHSISYAKISNFRDFHPIPGLFRLHAFNARLLSQDPAN